MLYVSEGSYERKAGKGAEDGRDDAQLPAFGAGNEWPQLSHISIGPLLSGALAGPLHASSPM